MEESIFLELDGKKYRGFTEINYTKSIEDLSGSFSFRASISDMKKKKKEDEKEKRFIPRVQDVCKIVINDRPLITGYIESIVYSYTENSHEISVNGRDKTCDIIDNSVVGEIEFNPPISLINLIRNVLDEAGLDDIKVINNAGDIDDFEKNEKITAEVGENMFDFLEKYCRKRSVLLTSDGCGDLVVSRAGKEQINNSLLNQLGKDGQSNNIKNASINYDFSNRYYGYICKSQGNPSLTDLPGNEEGNGLEDFDSEVGASAIDNEIRRTRILEFQAETSSIKTSNTERAIWESNIRRARSKVYNCEINHIFADPENTVFFRPNKLIHVKDDFLDINAFMLIKSVNYSLSVLTGTSVRLQLVSKDAYKSVASKDKKDSKYNKVGEETAKAALAPTVEQVSEFELEKAYYRRKWGI